MITVNNASMNYTMNFRQLSEELMFKKFTQFASLMMKHMKYCVCEKRSELISRHFTNDDEFLSIANMDSQGWH